MRQPFRLLVRELVRPDDHAQLAPGLNGVGLDHARIGEGDVLHLLQPLDVAFDHLAPGAGAGARNGVADLDDRGDQRGHLHLVVVGADGVADLGFLFEFLGELHADDCVRQFGLVIGHLADVVQQSRAAGRLGVEAQLSGHDARQVSRLACVLQQVLAVGGAVFHLADHADQLGVQAVDAQVDGGALAHLDDLLLDLFLHLGHHLLDAGGVDASVGDELVQGQPRDFAPHGVETAQDDRLGSVVHDDLDARRRLERTDVAPFAADDAALDLVALDVEHRHGVFDGRLGRHALDRRDDDALGLLGGAHLGLLDRFVDVGCGVGLGLGFHVFDQDVPCLLGAHPGDLFQAAVLLVHQAVDLLFLVFEVLDLALHLLLDPGVFADFILQLPLLSLQASFDLLGPLLALGEFLVAFVDLTVVFALELYELFFRLQEFLLLYHLALGFGLLDGGFAALADRVPGHQIDDQNVDPDSGYGGDAGS